MTYDNLILIKPVEKSAGFFISISNTSKSDVLEIFYFIRDEKSVSKNIEKFLSTPIFEDDNLLASCVLMEEYPVEDKGKDIFFVFCYNVQSDIKINYANGDIKEKETKLVVAPNP